MVLSGRICLDETYFSVAPGNRNVKGNGRLYRGLSQNKICAATATGGTGILLTVCGRAKPSRARMFKAFNGHTKTRSTLIHDGESSHGMLVEAFGLSEEIHASGETRGLPDKSNPMEPINSVHHGLKKFMRQRPSYDRNGLLNWLNLFWFIFTNRGGSMDDAVKKFLQMAILTERTVRCRRDINKNPDKKGV